MPRVALTRKQKLQNKLMELTRETKHELDDHGIKQKDIAELLELQPSAISKQFSKGHMTLEVLVAAQMMINGDI